MNTSQHKKGFTLVEMIVSIGLFTVVLFIATGAFLTVVNADRKSRATRIAMDNLNLTIEDMQRRIRTGSSYYCGAPGSTDGEYSGVKDCTNPTSKFSFTEQDTCFRTTYSLSDNIITRKTGPTSSSCTNQATQSIEVTAPEIIINTLKFMVKGSGTIDQIQPYVIILIEGIVGPIGNPTSATFKVQTTVTQRNYDS